MSCKNSNRASRWERLEAVKPEGPYGWVQWKGTDVCIDLHCSCGELGHVDADFFYHYKCLACGQLYDVSGYVKLVPVPKEEEDDGSRESTTHVDKELSERLELERQIDKVFMSSN